MMEFCLEGVEQATLFDPTGRSVVVNLPAPARYAVHKLLSVSGRTGAFRSKVRKDLVQVAALLEYFTLNDPDVVRVAWADAWSRGPSWRARARAGKRMLERIDAVLAKSLPTR